MADDDDVDFEGASPAYRRALGWVVALNLGYGAAEAVGKPPRPDEKEPGIPVGGSPDPPFHPPRCPARLTTS